MVIKNNRASDMKSLLNAVFYLILLMLFPTAYSLADQHPPTRAISAQQFERWMTEVSNWGRWGQDDELGTLNLVTPEKRTQAAALVKAGLTVSLSRTINTVKSVDNPRPLSHTMDETGANANDSATDTYSIHYHGLGHSHLDGLCHMFHKGKMYNGYSQGLVTEMGCAKDSILSIKNGIFTRGVLIDIPWLRGLSELPAGTAIMAEELDLWEKTTGIHIQSGDVLLVRTGRWVTRKRLGALDLTSGMAGLHGSTIHWLKARDIAVIGSDGITDAIPSGIDTELAPLHKLIITSLGTPLLDNLDLDTLTSTAQTLGRWQFLLTANPLAVQGGTGSPINAVAIF
jgi:kynurenine formamidase